MDLDHPQEEQVQPGRALFQGFGGTLGPGHAPGRDSCCVAGAGTAHYTLGKVSASLRAGDFSCEAHRAPGWESRSLQDPFSKWIGLTARLIDRLIDCLVD